jgi:hypothetical protein
MNSIITNNLHTLIHEAKNLETLLGKEDGAELEETTLKIIATVDAIKEEHRRQFGRFTNSEMQRKALELFPEDAAWKQIIDNSLVENIASILSECYKSLLEELPNPNKTMAIMGSFGSRKWQLFVLDVICQLKKQGCFKPDETGWMDNFEDTAGGCDEITWDAACLLIEEAE